jgi:hypothetical protein
MAATVEIVPNMRNPGLVAPAARAVPESFDRGDAAQYRREPNLGRPRASGFARMTNAAARLTHHRSDILGQLLRATCETVDIEDSPFRAI